MDVQKLKAEKRKIFGRKVKKLRKEGILPTNLVGKKVKSQAIKVNYKDFEGIYKKAGETGVIELTVNGKKHPVLIHNIQLDPLTDVVIHADFLQVDLKEKVVAQVPVELVSEASAEKEGKGTVVLYVDEVEVEALPKNLPDKFEINLSGLKEVDDAIKISDLVIDKSKVEVKNKPEQIIVKVEPLRKEEEVPVVEKVEEEEVVEEAKEEEKPAREEAVEVKKTKKEPSEARKT